MAVILNVVYNHLGPSDLDLWQFDGWYARKRSTLAAAMVFTAPGIPMLFQGQEFLEGK
jgi:1,4-alpha-glucan branching enzyme